MRLDCIHEGYIWPIIAHAVLFTCWNTFKWPIKSIKCSCQKVITDGNQFSARQRHIWPPYCWMYCIRLLNEKYLNMFNIKWDKWKGLNAFWEHCMLFFTFRFLQGILGNNMVFHTERRSSLLILGRNSTLDRLKTYVCVILWIYMWFNWHIEIFRVAWKTEHYACNRWVSKEIMIHTDALWHSFIL